MTINILTVFIIIIGIVSMNAFNNRTLMDRFLYIPYLVKHERQFYRIITHVLIHADWGHLVFNLLSLWFLGNGLLNYTPSYISDGNEVTLIDGGFIYYYGNMMGQLHFGLLFILGGIFATFIPFARHNDNPSYRSLGASGAVSAVIFAAIIWNPGLPLQILFIPFDIPAYIFGPLYFAYEFFADRRGGTGIAHDAHIGGALFGILYVLIINIEKGREFIQYFNS